MKITRHNYESFIIDYLDGTLDASKEKELMLFLADNPDIRNEFEEVEGITLSPGKLRMPGKNNLKKIDNSIPEFDLNCIAFIENDMNASEKQIFLDELSRDEEKSKIFKLYSVTKLNTGITVSFPEKDSLKKQDDSISEFDERCIAFIENDMSLSEKNLFLKETKNDALKSKILKDYSNTKLSPDLSVVFSGKEKLRKRAVLFSKSIVYTSLSAAAGILLIAGFFFLNRVPETNNASFLALSELSFSDIAIKHSITNVKTEENIDNEPEKTKIKIKKNSTIPVHQPEFIASQLPDEKLNNENEIVKKVTNENKEKQDSTKTLIIPNELLLKQNDKLLASNNTKKAQPEKKQGFLYYVEQGVNGFRNLTGKNVSMNHDTDEKGNTKQFAFNIGKFSVSHTKGN